MFKITLTPTYRVKVIVETPNMNGKMDKSDFMAEFKRCDLSQIDELRNIAQRDVVREVLTGWEGLIDEDGHAVPFNPATLEAVLSIPQAMIALIEAFWESVHKAKQKN